MNKVMMFAKLDLFTVKPYLTWKVSLLFLAACTMVGYGTGDAAVIIGMSMIYGVIFSSYPFAVGKKARWILCMPPCLLAKSKWLPGGICFLSALL